RLLARGAALGEPRQVREGVLIAGDGLAVTRPLHGTFTRLPQILHGTGVVLPPRKVPCQRCGPCPSLDPIPHFLPCPNALVQPYTSRRCHPAIEHLLIEGM